jgi:hypothetical protein
MRPADGEVLHFSEDPRITRFEPRVAATAADPRPLVWAVGADRAPDYWFPRDCPRAMAWVEASTTPRDAARVLGPGGGDRVHAVEYRWLERIRSVRLYAYRLAADRFHPVDDGPHPHAVVAASPVEPLGAAELVGDLFAVHERAGVQLRVLADLWPFWDAVTATTMGFSGIRLHNAERPRSAPRGRPDGADRGRQLR